MNNENAIMPFNIFSGFGLKEENESKCSNIHCCSVLFHILIYIIYQEYQKLENSTIIE